jgi:hypothetical protein
MRMGEVKSGKKLTTKGLEGMDLKQLYAFEAKDLVPDITVTRYSNLAYVQVSPRDVCIDFLEMPGVKKDGRMIVNGTRVYMSHVAAKRLGEVLQEVLKKASRDGGLEKLRVSP